MADLVLRMPSDALANLTGPVVGWMMERRALLSKAEADPSGLFLSLWDRVAELVYGAAQPGEALSAEEDLEFEALNRPGGTLASLLCEVLADARPDAGAGFGERLGPRFDRAVGAGGRAGLLARICFARHLPWLHHVAPAWAVKALLPRFAARDEEAEALWHARLRGDVPRHANLFNALKPDLLHLFHDGASAQHEAAGLAANLLAPALWSRSASGEAFEIEAMEVRRALVASGAGVRRQASRTLWGWMAEEEGEPKDRAERWRRVIGPFFRDIWPPDAACRDASVSHDLVLMALECQDAFPEAVEAVVDVIVPHDIPSFAVSLRPEGRHEDLPERHLAAFLRLLDAIVDPARALPPRDLADVLASCLSADPNLAVTAPYRRLHAIARRLAA